MSQPEFWLSQLLTLVPPRDALSILDGGEDACRTAYNLLIMERHCSSLSSSSSVLS